MSEEIKTLKDFKWKQNMKISALCDELKAEAVKWVKDCCGECRTDNETCEGCKRFIDFFNLTEEDLKDE